MISKLSKILKEDLQEETQWVKKKVHSESQISISKGYISIL